MVQGRGNADNSIMSLLRQTGARLEVVETNQKRGVHLDDDSDEELVVSPNPKLEVEEGE